MTSLLMGDRQLSRPSPLGRWLRPVELPPDYVRRPCQAKRIHDFLRNHSLPKDEGKEQIYTFSVIILEILRLAY